MDSTFNSVGDNVYVRDEKYEWLPATILELDHGNDRALVEIKFPRNWKDTTILDKEEQHSEAVRNQQKWVTMNDYPHHKLPRRSDIIVRDMADIPHLHEATMLYQVKERHAQHKPYTRVGEIVVAVNPCQWISDLYSEETQKAYARNLIWNVNPVKGSSSEEEKKDDDELVAGKRSITTGFGGLYDRLGYEPHIYEVSALAYRGLLIDGKDQAIFVSGESGAGKTETVKIVLKHLARLPEWQSNHTGSDGAQCSSHIMVDKILESIPIFEAFGNAKTRRNHNSSRFGKVTKLHFSVDKKQQVCHLRGTFTEAHLLEKSRVVSHCSEERNFHIFYQILNADCEEKEELLGADWRDAFPSDFRYLVTAPNEATQLSDHNDWKKTLHALQFFGWKNDELKSLIQALGVLLRLGNISFGETSKGKAVVDSENELQMLSKSIGVPAEVLEKSMTSKRIKAVDDEIEVPLSAAQAKECCDGLAKIIYSRLFGVLVDRINKQTHSIEDCKDQVISLLDMFGFESFDTNGFDQLCVNYSNEKLQHKYVHDNLLRLTKEYQDEGITLFDIGSVDNTNTVDLFESPSGIVKALDDECLRPSGTDESFVFKMKGTSSALNENNLHTRTEFSIQHFAGPVVYDAKGFITRNSDKLPRDIILVASKSANPIIRSELLELIQEEELAVKTKRKKTSIMQKFQVQLRTLLDNMSEMQVRYIRCIKPNDFLEPTRLDHMKTLQQIKCAGLVTAIEMGRKTFPDKLPFSLIEERFSCLLSSDYKIMLKDIPLHDRACLMMTFIFANFAGEFDDEELGLPYACGKTNVYFRAGAVEHLESLRQNLYTNKTREIQAWYRAKSQQEKYNLLRHSAVRIQSFHRSRKLRLQYLTQKCGIYRLQAFFFGSHLRKIYEKKRRAAKVVQNWFRLVSSKQKAIIRLQSWSRKIKAQRHFKRQVHVVVMLQSQARVRLSLKKYDRRKRASLKLTAFARMSITRVRYRKTRKAAVSVQTTSPEACEDNCLSTMTESLGNQFNEQNDTKFEGEDGSQRDGNNVNASSFSDGMDTKVNDCEGSFCRYCHQMRHDDTVSVNRQRIRDLRQEIVHVTEEAELHNRLVEAEFEERLSAYETEVLQLQNAVAYLETEKEALQKQMNTAQVNYMNTIKLLQRGIRDTTDSHKEYLSKIMSQLERSNDHRKAETARFSEELKSMKTSSEARIKSLEMENAKLRNALEEKERLRQIVSEKADVLQEVNRLSRKIEKLVSPQQILSVVDSVSCVAGQRTAVIEKHISTRCRKSLYHLEDLIMYTVDETNDFKKSYCSGTEAEVIGLQNQLVRAYEDIEQLQDEITRLRSVDAAGEANRKATKNYFKRHQETNERSWEKR